MAQYTIRRLTKEEMKYPVDWAAQEGWNPGLYDAESFFATDPSGFLLGLLDDEPIGCISAVSYGDFGFLGFYIVKPEHRKKGYGIQLWNEAVKYLEDKNVGLNGVVEQQENYKKSGFKLAYRNIRYQGKGTGEKKTGKNLVELSEVPFDEIVQYDEELFPASRLAFLELWFKQPESLSLAAVVKGKLHGYGMVRKCREGYKIGPLFADSKKYAKELLDAFISFVPKGENVYFDIPEPNKAAVELVEEYKMKKVFETARMYTKGEPDIQIDRIFGVTTFELG